MPLHEQTVSILSLRPIGVVLVSSDLFSGLVTASNIFRELGGIRSKSLAVFRSETFGPGLDNYYTVHVGGNANNSYHGTYV